MSRKVKWMKGAQKAVKKFPVDVKQTIADTLSIIADGLNPDNIKPMKGLGSGVSEIRITYRSDAYRAIYTLEIAGVLYVIHAFQKKATKGISTPKKEIDLVKSRLKLVKEAQK